MIDYQIFLRGFVVDWNYSRDIRLSDDRPLGRSLNLKGETEFRGFIKRMPFSITLLSDLQYFSKEEILEMLNLEIIEADKEYETPDFLEVNIPVNREQLLDLKRCLLIINSPYLSVEIQLEVEGLQKETTDSHDIKPREDKPMRVRSFSWTLHRNEDQISQYFQEVQ